MFLFFFLIVDLYVLVRPVFEQIFNLIAKLVIPIGITTKVAKEEMKTYPAIVKIMISK